MSTKFFIPGWVLESKELTPGAKLILSVLSTRSTETPEGRLSKGMGSGTVADLTGMHVASTDRLLKSMEKDGYLKIVKNGYLLLDPSEDTKTGDPSTTSIKETDLDASKAESRALFGGVTTFSQLWNVLIHNEVSHTNIHDMMILLFGKVNQDGIDAVKTLYDNGAKILNICDNHHKWVLNDIIKANEEMPVAGLKRIIDTLLKGGK